LSFERRFVCKAGAKVIKVFNNASTLMKIIETILELKSQVADNVNGVVQ